MWSVLKHCGAALAGLIVGVILIASIESINYFVNPPPPDLDYNDWEAMARYIATLPLRAFLIVLAAYAAGSFAGAALATRLAPRRFVVPGIVVVVLLLLAGISNMVSIPHPAWFMIACLAVFPVFGGLGVWLVSGGAPSASPPMAAAEKVAP